MKHIKYLGLSTLLLLGCSTSGPKEATHKNANANQNRPAEQYMSERGLTTVRPEQCPASATVWRRQQTQQIIRYANFCVLSSNWARVENLGSHLAEVEPSSPWGAYFLSLAAQGRKEYARAIWMADLAVLKSPRTAAFVYQKARIFWDMQDYDAAVVNFEKSLKLDPKLADAHLTLAQIYSRDHNFKKSDQHYAEFLAQEPQHAAALSGYAEVKLKLGRANQAVEFYERAVSASPRNVSYRLRLAAIYETQLKDNAQALSTYKKLKSVSADSRSIAQELGMDLDSKIKSLEMILAKDSPGEKVSGRAKSKGRVK